MARFMGAEYGDVFVDQGEQISQDWHERLLESNRQVGVPGFKPRYIVTANPGGISHGYLKRVFIDRLRYLEHESPADYAFIPAFAWDNVEWSRDALRVDGLTQDDYDRWTDEQRFEYFIKRTSYGKILNAKGKKRRNSMLLGLWNEYDGQYFDCFDAEKDPVTYDSLGLKTWTRRWISMDWGFRHKTTVYWHAQIGEHTSATYREFVTSGTSVEEIGHTIGQLSRRQKTDGTAEVEPIGAFYLGGDAFAHKTDEQTINIRLGRVLAEYGIPAPSRAHDAPGSRKARGAVAYDRLAAKTWLIARTCPELIQLLPDLQSDPDDVDTVLKVEGDDPWDGWSYGVLTPSEKERIPLAEQIRQVTEAEFKRTPVPDMTLVHLAAMRAQEKFKHDGKPIRLPRRAYGGARA
jgi:hypothetical protein